MTKRILTPLLLLALLLSLGLPAGAYGDLSGHWAEEYITDLADRGILSGYQDGTMKPDQPMSFCEALVMISRLYPTDALASRWLESDYGDLLDEALPEELSWARDGLAVCLAAGILKESELRKLNLSEGVEKEELAVFLVRALGMSADAAGLISAELSFADADQITLSYRGFVSVLAQAGIVGGNDGGSFEPHRIVTRALAAAMVSRTIAYQEKNGLTPALEHYYGVSRAEGFLSAVSETELELRSFAGPVCRFPRRADTEILVSGVRAALTDAYLGCAVTLFVREGTAILVQTDRAGSYRWVSGTVESCGAAGLRVGGTTYAIDGSTVLLRDDDRSSVSGIQPGDLAVLKLQDDQLCRLYAYAAPVTVSGSITTLTLGATVELVVGDAEGLHWCFSLPVSTLPPITHAGSIITLDRLGEGDEVCVTMSGTAVESIALVDTVSYVSGRLGSVLTSADGIQWFLELPEGRSIGYLLEDRPGVYNGGAPISVSDVAIGAEVTVSVSGSRITKIELLAAAPSENKVSGSVLGADAAGVLTILSGGRLVYVETAGASLLRASDGTPFVVSGLAENTPVTAFGRFLSSNRMAATVLVAE